MIFAQNYVFTHFKISLSLSQGIPQEGPGLQDISPPSEKVGGIPSFVLFVTVQLSGRL